MMIGRGLAAALALCGLLAATGAHAGKKDDTLNVVWDRQLNTLDQYFNTDREGIVVGRLIWDTLIERDPITNEYLPQLATAWKWIDPVTLEMQLREGVQFHNGEKFDADDVVYTLNFVSDPASKVPGQGNVNWIKRAEKLGEYAVRIHLKQPFPAALEFLSGPLSIYPNEYYAKVGPQGMGREPVGTGPYRVTQVEAAKSITFVRNERYFPGPKGKPAIAKIVQRTVPDTTTQIAELISGRADWLWKVPADQAEKLKAIPNVSVDAAETMRFGYIGFDAAGRAGDHPFKNLKVRQAVAHAIDREAMVKNLVRGNSRVLHAVCFPSQLGCIDDGAPRYEFDVEKAKKLLAEAGYPNGFDAEIYAYRERPYTEAVIGYLRTIGIRAKLNWMQYAALAEKNRSGETPLFHMTWGSNSINDASASVSYFFRGGADDFARDPAVMSALEAADNSIDTEARKRNYNVALRRIAEQVYWLPMFSIVVNYAYAKELEFRADADEVPRFYLAKWK